MKKEIILVSFLLSVVSVSGLDIQTTESISNVHARHMVLLTTTEKNWLCIGYLISLNQVLTGNACLDINVIIDVRPILNLKNNVSQIRTVKKIYINKNPQGDKHDLIVMELDSRFPQVKEFEPIILKFDQENVIRTSCQMADISLKSRLKRDLLGADLEMKKNLTQDNEKTQKSSELDFINSPLKHKTDETKLKRNDAFVPSANINKITNTTESRIVRAESDSRRQGKGSETNISSESLKSIRAGNNQSSKHHQTDSGFNKTTIHSDEKEKKKPIASTDTRTLLADSSNTTNKNQSGGKPLPKHSIHKNDNNEVKHQIKAGNDTDNKDSTTDMRETVIAESEADKKNGNSSLDNTNSTSIVDNVDHMTTLDGTNSTETVDLANNNTTVDKENGTALFDFANDNAPTTENPTPRPNADENLSKRLLIKSKTESEVPRENNLTIHHNQYTVSLVVSDVEIIDKIKCDQKPVPFRNSEDSNILCVENKFCLKKQDGNYWNMLTSGGKLIGMFDYKKGQEDCSPYKILSLKKWKSLIECAQNERSCSTEKCSNICKEKMGRMKPSNDGSQMEVPTTKVPSKREKQPSRRNQGSVCRMNRAIYFQLALFVFFSVVK